MNCTAEMLRLYAVTDRAWVGKLTLPQHVEAALKGGATCVQLREKNLADSSILAEAREISALCKQYRVPFILNDNVALAAQCGADGVHLGQEDMDPAEARRILGPDAIIGVSAHNVAEAKAAVAAGADYLGCGAMFATTTKRTSPPCPRRRCGPSAPPSPCRSSPSAASANRTCSPSPTAAKRALHWSAPSSRRMILKRSAGS